MAPLDNPCLNREHRVLLSNSSIEDVEILFFFDSRAVNDRYIDSLAHKITQLEFLHKVNAAVVVRPVGFTTWATLVQFIRVSKCEPDLIVTNVGLVDLMPRPADNFDFVRNAYESFCSDILPVIEYGQPLSSGRLPAETLYMFGDFETKAIAGVREELSGMFVVGLAAPVPSAAFEYSRERPANFPKLVIRANDFSRQIVDLWVDVLDTNHLSGDGVHITRDGESALLSAIEKILEGYLNEWYC